MAPHNQRGNRPGRGGRGRSGGFPEMPRQDDGPRDQAPFGVEAETQLSRQEEELINLEAIYSGCFERKKSKTTAWKQQEAVFEVLLTSTPLPDNPSMSFVLKVTVELPVLYPKTAPRFHLNLDMGLHRVFEESMKLTVEAEVARMLKNNDTQIVLDVLQQLQIELDKATVNKAEGAKLPSLEEQRAMQLAELENRKAEEKAAREEEERKKNQAEKAKNKTLAKTARFEASQSTPRPTKPRESSSEIITSRDNTDQDFVYNFGKMLKVKDINGVEREVHGVKGYQFHARGPVSDCYKVAPDMPILASQFFIVKRSRIKRPAPGTGASNDTTVDSLHNSVRDAMDIGKGSNHIVQIHAYEIKYNEEEDDKPASWSLDILMEHGSMGSLSQFMSSAQQLTSNRACELALEILEGLAYLHDNGVIHRDLHASNILLAQTTDGNVVAKIADINFQDMVHRMTGVASCNQLLSKKNSVWAPPELCDGRLGSYTEKTDVWFCGMIFLQMLFGLNFKTLFSDVESIFADDVTSDSQQDLFSKMFQRKPKRRARALDLKGCSYFTDNNGTADTPERRNSALVAPHSIMSRPPTRFAKEFQNLGELGKGGFGQVIKARKRIDAIIYAVKRIRESPGMPFDEMVREVQSMSSLHSIYIVRYYGAWVEYVPRGLDSNRRKFTNDGTDSDFTKPGVPPSRTQTSQYGKGASLSQSLDWVAKKSPLSRRLTEDTIEEETEDEVESGHESTGSDADDDDGESSEDDESDEEEKFDFQSEALTGKSNYEIEFDDSNPFGNDSRDAQDNGTDADRNEHAILDSEEEEDTDYENSGADLRELYIQMELCDGDLRTAILKEQLYDNPREVIRLLRQILEGLKYIHSQNQIHRDLKPENIFFHAEVRSLRTIRIGDFGLAAMGARRQFADAQNLDDDPEDDRRTGGVGTAYYVAPEVKNGDRYGSKADMYSLGIILFELCYHPMEGMERNKVLEKLRDPNPQLPEDFHGEKFGGLDKIIMKLVTHNQDERPTAEDVLESGDLPDAIGMDVIRAAMNALTAPKSVFHQEVVKGLLSRRRDEDEEQIKRLAWSLNNKTEPPDPCETVMRRTVKDELTRLFRHHGAVDIDRPTIFPIVAENESKQLAQVLGSDGTVLQLRYDLNTPLALTVATIAPELEKLKAFGGTVKCYSIESVYRQEEVNVISSHGEAAFDIISDGNDLSIKEAEVIKVLEEITTNFPCLTGENICFNINHSDILTLVFDHCDVHFQHRDLAIDQLARLSVNENTWHDVERTLLGKGLSRTSVLKLQGFIFREHPDAAFSKLRTLLEDDTDLAGRLELPISHIQEVLHYLGLLGVKSKILIAPLGCAKEKLCRGGLTFSCQIENTREILGAGGRYDSLVSKFADKDKAEPKLSHAVGFGLGWDILAQKMVNFYVNALTAKKSKKSSAEEVSGIWRAKRCDVLVCSYDKNLLRNEALSLLNDLWVQGISAELARDARKPDDIHSAYKEDSHYWNATIKQDKSVKIRTVGQDVAKNGDPKAKKNLATGDCTVPINEVIGKLKALIRERESSGHGGSHTVVTKRPEQPLAVGGDSHITVVGGDTKNRKKKANDLVRSNVQTASMDMLQQMVREVQTFAIDLPNDSELDRLQDIPLSAEARWRELAQRSYNGEVRGRLQALYEELLAYRSGEYRERRPRHVILCNLRTGHSVLYDIARDA